MLRKYLSVYLLFKSLFCTALQDTEEVMKIEQQESNLLEEDSIIYPEVSFAFLLLRYLPITYKIIFVPITFFYYFLNKNNYNTTKNSTSRT